MGEWTGDGCMGLRGQKSVVEVVGTVMMVEQDGNRGVKSTRNGNYGWEQYYYIISVVPKLANSIIYQIIVTHGTVYELVYYTLYSVRDDFPLLSTMCLPIDRVWGSNLPISSTPCFDFNILTK